MTPLAGRILANFVSGMKTTSTRLPIVGRKPPTVGPVPVRCLGVKRGERLMALSGGGQSGALATRERSLC